jgi:hypothetical protein
MYLSNMKKLCIRLFERLRYAWWSLAGRPSHDHDPFLVRSMASFNFDGGWRELLLKASPKHMPEESTVSEEFAV